MCTSTWWIVHIAIERMYLTMNICCEEDTTKSSFQESIISHNAIINQQLPRY